MQVQGLHSLCTRGRDWKLIVCCVRGLHFVNFLVRASLFMPKGTERGSARRLANIGNAYNVHSKRAGSMGLHSFRQLSPAPSSVTSHFTGEAGLVYWQMVATWRTL